MRRIRILMARQSLVVIAILAMTGCVNYVSRPLNISQTPLSNKMVNTIGYGAVVSYKNYPLAQRKLLAIRAARLDAYRNLAEEIYGVKINGKTTVKDMVIQNDQYRISINAVLRGAHISSITERNDGIFEAHASVTLTPRYVACLSNPSDTCLNAANQYQPAIVVENQSIINDE